ncbi:MAG: DUF6259 domain-containing protein, partial [Clostridiales bacterium]|nr:DUF6259 domain-containing protein [Clostridiales bacterium]
MYKSRLHFENGSIHLALDAITGEVLELCDVKRGENLIKNSLFQLSQPFTVTLRNDKGELLELSAPINRVALRRPEIRAVITSEQVRDDLVVRVVYDCLTKEETVYPVRFSYTVAMNGDTLRWNCRLENASGQTVTEVRFPILNGIWMGRDWSDNVLYYPNNTGERYFDPIEYFSRQPRSINWRWQEYRYGYLMDGINSAPDMRKRGLNGFSARYPGSLCMSWMELDDGVRGLYFGCHDPRAKPNRLEAGTCGTGNPGMCFASAFEPRIVRGEVWNSPDTLTVLHDGDWHRGAEIYRSFRVPLLSPRKKAPSWLSESVGLFAHYDFKYQNGGVVHTYRDIPRLAREARERGFCHILLSGWNRDGFDCGYPMYEPDPDLGTEEELIAGIREAKAMGVHVTFYMNILIHNRKYYSDTVDAKATMEEDGTVASVSYGNPEIKFSNMCPQSKLWREEIEELVRRATDVYGIDGVYFDQLGCGVKFCFNPEHHHEYDGGNAGYIRILQEVADAYESTHGDGLCIMGEWTIDTFGTLVDLQLSQIFYTYHTGAFPEMYRFTFPDHGVTDMLYPGQNMAMRPVHVAQSSREIMARLYENGSYFWVYDLVDDNTFTRDPEGMKRLDEVIALAKLRRRLLPDARFC